jgi:tRNA-specific 2-thiouridylase
VIGNQAWVRFDAPQRDVTAGQAAVFYQGDLMIGGGIIV